MKMLLKSAQVVDPQSAHHNKTRDVLIEDGVILSIKESIDADKSVEVIERENLHISPGWIDSHVTFGEPGNEDRQTIENGLDAAAAGGFTHVIKTTNASPIPEDASGVRSLIASAKHHPVCLKVMGALTKGFNGKDLAELHDMRQAGAVGFYDYKEDIADGKLLKLAMQYTAGFPARVVSYANDSSIAGNGIVNEDDFTVNLGLRARPDIAESIRVQRDLELAEYTGGKLHIPLISTAKSAQLIHDAKKSGQNISCSVGIAYLILTSEVLSDYEAHFKMEPPLRTDLDVKLLVKHIMNNDIDCVTSDHTPLMREEKELEFERAETGTIGLEFTFGLLNMLFPLERAIKLLTGAYDIFEIKRPIIEEGEKVNLTLFEPDARQVVKEENIVSTAKNCAFLNRPMKGKVYGILRGVQNQFNNG